MLHNNKGNTMKYTAVTEIDNFYVKNLYKERTIVCYKIWEDDGSPGSARRKIDFRIVVIVGYHSAKEATEILDSRYLTDNEYYEIHGKCRDESLGKYFL